MQYTLKEFPFLIERLLRTGWVPRFRLDLRRGWELFIDLDDRPIGVGRVEVVVVPLLAR